jgi:hypothetical protein
MTVRVLFPPQHQQQGRQLRKDHLGSMDFGMATGAERNHQVQNRFTGHPMMDGDRPLIAARCSADPAAVAVALQDRFPETSEMLLILPLQGVAGRTQAVRKDLHASAGTAKSSLDRSLHRFPALLTGT